MSEKKSENKRTALMGMKAIEAHLGKSYNTILRLVREEGFPATKVLSEWVSDTELIAAWLKERISRK